MKRKIELQKFAEKVSQNKDVVLKLISGDASFRKYYRANDYIFVDAPPKTEKNREFIRNSKVYLENGIVVPKVVNADLDNGFLCITDLGNTMFSDLLTKETIKELYTDAIMIAAKIGSIKNNWELYDRSFILRELQIFIDWYVGKHSNVFLSTEDIDVWNEMVEILVNNDLEQSQGTMHRDFHCRNIMVLEDKTLAVIDFQDTVCGPITYDLVSLLKDCYFTIPNELRLELLALSFSMYKAIGLIESTLSFTSFKKYFDLTGMQRHLKAIGIFCRLYYRDGKDSYLQYLERTFGYIKDVCEIYPELAKFNELLNNKFIKRG